MLRVALLHALCPMRFLHVREMVKTYPMAFVTAPGKIEFRNCSLPELSAKDVLIRVKATAICGSDLHIFKGKHPFVSLPVAVGHELSGEILRVGKKVTRVKEGDRVVVEPVIVCGRCHFCRRGHYSLCQDISFQYRKGQGAFAPYFVAEEPWVHPLPPNVSFEEGALVEPLSVAIHAVSKANLEIGQSVAIFGAGTIGLMVLTLCRLSGVGEVFIADVQKHRLNKAKEFGASEILDNTQGEVVEKILERTDQLGVDRSFEAVGLQGTLAQSLQVLKKGGSSVLVGLFDHPDVRIPANLFIQREISLSGSQGYCWDFQTALKMLEGKKIAPRKIISHLFPIGALQEAFELLSAPRSKAIKVVIENT